MFSYFLVIFLVVHQHLCVDLPEGVPEINRKILGSNGPFRDFVHADCEISWENKWSRCQDDNPQLIYHWNQKLKGCEMVMYRGCGATRNNFLTLRDCEKQAIPTCMKESSNKYRNELDNQK